MSKSVSGVQTYHICCVCYILCSKGGNEMLRSAGAILFCIATPGDKNIIVATNFDRSP